MQGVERALKDYMRLMPSWKDMPEILQHQPAAIPSRHSTPTPMYKSGNELHLRTEEISIWIEM